MSSQDGSSSSGTPTKMSGYLMKKSTAGDWQKRYFETNGCFLTYYKSQKMSKLLAALSLPQVGDIRLGKCLLHDAWYDIADSTLMRG